VRKQRSILAFLSAILMAAFLISCGGGSQGSLPASNTPPASTGALGADAPVTQDLSGGSMPDVLPNDYEPDPDPNETVTSDAVQSKSVRATKSTDACYGVSTGQLRYPLPNRVPYTDKYGPFGALRPQPLDPTRYRIHYGADLKTPVGTMVFAAASGTVVQISVYDKASKDYKTLFPYKSRLHGFGNAILIRSAINGHTVYTLYGHLQEVGDGFVANPNVTSGEIIGKSGRSGISSASITSHLHFQLGIDRYGGTDADKLAAWDPVECHNFADTTVNPTGNDLFYVTLGSDTLAAPSFTDHIKVFDKYSLSVASTLKCETGTYSVALGGKLVFNTVATPNLRIGIPNGQTFTAPPDPLVAFSSSGSRTIPSPSPPSVVPCPSPTPPPSGDGVFTSISVSPATVTVTNGVPIVTVHVSTPGFYGVISGSSVTLPLQTCDATSFDPSKGWFTNAEGFLISTEVLAPTSNISGDGQAHGPDVYYPVTSNTDPIPAGEGNNCYWYFGAFKSAGFTGGVKDVLFGSAELTAQVRQ